MILDPLKDWYADESKMFKLEQALRDPVLMEAMQVLRYIAIPRSNFTDRSSAEAITHAAFEQNRNAGFFSYAGELWGLTEKLAKPPVTPQGYSDSYCQQWAKEHGYWEDFEQKEQQP